MHSTLLQHHTCGWQRQEKGTAKGPACRDHDVARPGFSVSHRARRAANPEFLAGTAHGSQALSGETSCMQTYDLGARGVGSFRCSHRPHVQQRQQKQPQSITTKRQTSTQGRGSQQMQHWSRGPRREVVQQVLVVRVLTQHVKASAAFLVSCMPAGLLWYPSRFVHSGQLLSCWHKHLEQSPMETHCSNWLLLLQLLPLRHALKSRAPNVASLFRAKNAYVTTKLRTSELQSHFRRLATPSKIPARLTQAIQPTRSLFM